MKLKDKKIELLRQVHTRDEMGITTTTLESMGTVWAYFRHLSGKEVFAAATVNYKEEVLFQVNYRTDLTTANVIQYNGRLYKVVQAHSTQSDWTPDITPALWTVIDIEHSGTLEDPIPAVASMEYIKGKYYIENGTIYLMNRQGMADGESIVLHYTPSQLVGQYFEVV